MYDDDDDDDDDRPRMHRLATVHARDNQRPTSSRHSLSQ